MNGSNNNKITARMQRRFRSSGRKARITAIAIGCVAVLGVGAGVVQAVVPDQPEVPINNPSLGQAADVQSIINVWNAYAADLDSNNTEGVASLMTPTGGYTFQADSQTMSPSACSPQPGASTTCIPDGGCVALGYQGIQTFLPGVGYTPEHPWAGQGQHQLGDPVVKLAPDGKTATLYVYFNFGRYINDLVKTRAGWKVQWERIVWQDIGGFPCHVDWSSDNKPGLLGTDLYYLELPVGGPQLPTAQLSNPAFVRTNAYIQQALAEVNAGNYGAPCQTINNLVKFVSRGNGLDSTHRTYLQTIAARFLADDGCNGITPPDRTQSDGSWAAATAWAAYEMSGQPNLVPTPSDVPPFSAVSGLL